MNCKRYQRWISDRLDGALSEKKEKGLEVHLRSCASCRAFGRAAQQVQEEAKALPAAAVPEAYWSQSLDRLKAKLAAPQTARAKGIGSAWVWRLAWLTAPLLLAAVAAWLLFRLPGRQAIDELANDEERMGAIYSELGESLETEQAFDQALESSIQENLSAGSDVREAHLENPLLYRVVSEEEMGLLLQELKKGMKT